MNERWEAATQSTDNAKAAIAFMNDTRMDESAATDQPMASAAHEQPLNVIRDATSSYNQFLVCGSLFEVPAKYMPIKPIGKGAYGIVW